jgi:hypothetical protein
MTADWRDYVQDIRAAIPPEWEVRAYQPGNPFWALNRLLAHVETLERELAEERGGGTRNTEYGFIWGPLHVTRAVADERIGWVLLVRNAITDEEIEIRASPAGRSPLRVKKKENNT